MALVATTAPIQGSDVLLGISTDNGATFKTVVCLTKQGNELAATVNEVETQCGPLVGIGTVKETITVEGAVNIVPVAETHISYKELKAIVKARSAIKFEQTYADTPDVIDSEGKAYITDLKHDAPVGNVVTFTATLKVF